MSGLVTSTTVILIHLPVNARSLDKYSESHSPVSEVSLHNVNMYIYIVMAEGFDY